MLFYLTIKIAKIIIIIESMFFVRGGKLLIVNDKRVLFSNFFLSNVLLGICKGTLVCIQEKGGER